jgi:hypothetical protein
MVAASSRHPEVTLVLGEDSPEVPPGWVDHPLLVGGDRVGTLLLNPDDPEGPEPRQARMGIWLGGYPHGLSVADRRLQAGRAWRRARLSGKPNPGPPFCRPGVRSLGGRRVVCWLRATRPGTDRPMPHRGMPNDRQPAGDYRAPCGTLVRSASLIAAEIMARNHVVRGY